MQATVNTYVRGQRIRCEGRWVNALTGAAVDPASPPRFLLRDPSSTGPDDVQIEYVYGVDVQVVRLGTGIYIVDVVGSLEGRYRYRWENVDQTANFSGADETYFTVRQGPFA